MALRDTTWAKDTAGAPITANANYISDKPFVERRDFGLWGTRKRTRNIITSEWILMTQAGARAAAAAMADTGNQYSAEEVNRITGEWKLARTQDTYGAWS